MKKEIRFLAAMVMLVVAGSLTLIYAQSMGGARTNSAPADLRADFPPPPPDGFRGGPHRGPDIFGKLDLTDPQREQIEAIRFGSREASQEFETKLRAVDDQLRMMVESGSFDVEKARPLVRAKADAMASIELNRLSADAEIQKLLTTDQKAKLAQFKERRPPPPPGGGFGPPER